MVPVVAAQRSCFDLGSDCDVAAMWVNRKDGWLQKKSTTHSRWNKRYFVLSNGCLSYYADEQVGCSLNAATNVHGLSMRRRTDSGWNCGVCCHRAYHVALGTLKVLSRWTT